MKKNTKIFVGIGIALLAFVIISKSRTKIPEYEIATVQKQTVEEQVNVTGKVKPAEVLDLAFEQSGKVSAVKVKVGDRVAQNAVLANLSSADSGASLRRSSASIASARADVAQYEAALQNEQVKLFELKNGNRSEEIIISEANLQKAKSALIDAQNNFEVTREKTVTDLQNVYNETPEILQSAYITGSAAFLEEVDPLFLHQTDYDVLSFLTKDYEKKTTIERERIILKNIMKSFESELSNMPTDEAGLDVLLLTEKQKLLALRDFFTLLSSAVDNNANLSFTTENLYRGYVNTARTSVSSALSSITTGQQSISSQRATNNNSIQTAQSAINAAQKAVEVANHELELKRAGARPEEISAQESRVKQAEANVLSARARVAAASADYQGALANFDKTILRSPIAGIVTSVEAKVGEFMASTKPAISIISEADYEIEANIPEVDIAKITTTKTAQVTLDAYGEGVVFNAQVSKVDPAETIVEGVATYTITLQFLAKDERIKSGMTANTRILTDKRENVVALPARAIINRDGKKFVKIITSPKSLAQEVEVETGLRGSEGNIEITRGLLGGETLVLSEAAK